MRAVLLVDDEPDMGRLVAMSLEDLDVEVIQALTVREAAKILDEKRVSVVLLDISLDSEDGIAQLPKLRDHPSLEDVPIVVFSVHDSRRAEALEAGATEFVSKPFHRADLREAVKASLSMK